jgi:hypothetical protein
MNNYSGTYAMSLLAETPPAQLVEGRRAKKVPLLSDRQVALMECESQNLEREFKIAAKAYGKDQLDLVLIVSYLRKLVANVAVARFLRRLHPDISAEFQRLSAVDLPTS